MASEGTARDCVPTRTAAGCVPWDGVRGRSPRWPVQARDAFPAMAVGCLIRTRWRSGRSNHGAESCADRQSDGSLVPAQRLAHQPRRRIDRDCVPGDSNCQNRHDLGPRAASGCMRWLGGTTPEVRVDLPAMLAPEGGAWDGVRMRFSAARLDAMTVGCVPRDGARGPSRRFRSHQDGVRMRALGWRPRAFPVLACPGMGCAPCDGARMPDSRMMAVRPRQSRG